MRWIMASPEPPDREPAAPARDAETVDATAAAGPSRAPLLEHIDVPVYRPRARRRTRVAVRFWLGFVLAAAVAAGIVVLIVK